HEAFSSQFQALAQYSSDSLSKPSSFGANLLIEVDDMGQVAFRPHFWPNIGPTLGLHNGKDRKMLITWIVQGPWFMVLGDY
ncbi:hypothetical protein Tco_0389451, partial [Tanacetum coccineum]